MAEERPVYNILRKVALFADLPETDIRRLCEASEGVELAAGQQLFAEGAPGDRAYVVTNGELEVVKDSVGREVLLNVIRSGEVVGEIALLENKPRMATVRARTDSSLIAIHRDQLDHLLQTSLPATRAMFFAVLSRWRATDALLRQGEKMAQLGTLTAGVAHELNNPAAAVKRGANQLRHAVTALASAQEALWNARVSATQRQRLEAQATRVADAAAHPFGLDVLTRSDRQAALETWLEDNAIPDPWEVGPTLVDAGITDADLWALRQDLPDGAMAAAVRWLAATYAVHSLLTEVFHGAGRISDIVKALKSYTYLDQAPMQEVDLHEGLEQTLLILRGKLKGGVTVDRQYAADLPRLQAYGSELNQVWTNILDNAIDAMDGKGTITLRTRREGVWAVVEIEDTGPGIPPEIQGRIFDPFFTTKPPGKGTGLGLDITYNIVVNRHRGDIRVSSQPGKTRFEVRIPLELGPAAR